MSTPSISMRLMRQDSSFTLGMSSSWALQPLHSTTSKALYHSWLKLRFPQHVHPLIAGGADISYHKHTLSLRLRSVIRGRPDQDKCNKQNPTAKVRFETQDSSTQYLKRHQPYTTCRNRCAFICEPQAHVFLVGTACHSRSVASVMSYECCQARKHRQLLSRLIVCFVIGLPASWKPRCKSGKKHRKSKKFFKIY